MEDFNQGLNAEIVMNKDFIGICTLSGRGVLYPDIDCDYYVLPIDINESDLGAKIRSALDNSRRVSEGEFSVIWKNPKLLSNYIENKVFRVFNYKSWGQNNNLVIKVTVCDRDGRISFGCWDTDGKGNSTERGLFDNSMTILSSADHRELGWSALVSLSRCTIKGSNTWVNELFSKRID